MIEYKGYYAEPIYSQEDKCFIGQVLGIEHQILFEGSTPGEIEQDFRNAIDHYLKFCEKKCINPQKSNVCSVQLNLTPSLYEKAIQSAKQKEIPLDDWVAELVKDALGKN